MMTRSRLLNALAVLCVLPASVAAGPGAAFASGGGGGEGDVHLVAMPMLDVPIVEGSRTTGRLRLKLTLRAADADGVQAIEADLPGLREAALAAAGEFARLRASPYRAVDAGRLSGEMSTALAARDHAVTGVLLIEVSSARS